MCNEKFAYSVFCSLHLFVPSRTTVTTAGPKSRLDPLTLTSANAVGLLTVSGITHTATAGPANSNQQLATPTGNQQHEVNHSNSNPKERLKFVPTTISANSAAHSQTTLCVLGSPRLLLHKRC